MGITKLMHMKESRRPPGNIHLKNGLEYILKPEKTKDRLLAGGNCGCDPETVLEVFMDTKREFEKCGGRQGYHFVISFSPGETDEETVRKVAEDFCREYLGDAYDYVYAVHDDTKHLHAHIVFNSVSRLDGIKFHYRQGDWKKFIQPVTDEVCKKYGLAQLEYEEEKPRAGRSYADWSGGISRRDIVRADIDYAIEKSGSMEEFFQEMKKFGYLVTRQGTGKKGPYFSLLLPAGEGKKRPAVRSSGLGVGYSAGDIESRIRNREYFSSYENLTEKIKETAGLYLKPFARFHSQSQAKLIRASSYYQIKNPYAVPAWQVREDMKKTKELVRQCEYLVKHGISSIEEVETHRDALASRLTALETDRKMRYVERKKMTGPEREASVRFLFLHRQLQRTDLPDTLWETYAEELEELKARFPGRILETEKKIAGQTAQIKFLRKEKNITEQILELEQKKWNPEKNVPKEADVFPRTPRT